MSINFKKLFFPHDEKPDHIKGLDGLRGVAVLIVVLAHGGDFGFIFSPIVNLQYFGKIGVYVFFILSGYLLDRQIIYKLLTNSASYSYWLNYLLRRFLRIFPLLFISLVIYYLLNKSIVKTFISEKSDIWRHLILEDGKWFYWSIPVEFRYYLISPIILIICYKMFNWNLKKSLSLLIGIVVFSVLTEAIFNHGPISTIRFLPVFLVGTAIVLIENFSPQTLQRNFNKIAWICIFIIPVMVPFYWEYLFNIHFSLETRGAVSIYGILIGFIFLAVRYNKGLLRAISELKFLRFLGTISFSLYLFHMAVGLIINKYSTGNMWIDAMLYFSCSVLFSSLTYLLIEYPLSKISLVFLMKKRKFFSNTIRVLISRNEEKVR